MAWSGAAAIEPGRLIFSGELGTAHHHAHAAVQIAVATAETMVFTDARGEQIRAPAGVIPPGAEHAIDAGSATGIMIYLEPTGLVGRRLVALFDSLDRDRAASWKFAAGFTAVDVLPQDLSNAADAVIYSLLGAGSPTDRAHALHAGVQAAVEIIPTLLTGPVFLRDVARAVHLSSDRLGRLFAKDVGMSFSAYVRWARLIRAMEVAREGGTITDAAHAAGFSDSSHANRAFHEMFGIAPIALHRNVILS